MSDTKSPAAREGETLTWTKTLQLDLGAVGLEPTVRHIVYKQCATWYSAEKAREVADLYCAALERDVAASLATPDNLGARAGVPDDLRRLSEAAVHFFKQFRQGVLGEDHGSPAVRYRDPSFNRDCWFDIESKRLLGEFSATLGAHASTDLQSGTVGEKSKTFQPERIAAAQEAYDDLMYDQDRNAPDFEVHALAAMQEAIRIADAFGSQTAYQYREIGEGEGWKDCSKSFHDDAQNKPELDTRIVALADPRPQAGGAPGGRVYTEEQIEAKAREVVSVGLPDNAKWLLASKDTWQDRALKAEAAITPPAADPGAQAGAVEAEWKGAVGFLVDRLTEFGRDGDVLTEDGIRDWEGHIAPAMGRLRTLAQAEATPIPAATGDAGARPRPTDADLHRALTILEAEAEAALDLPSRTRLCAAAWAVGQALRPAAPITTGDAGAERVRIGVLMPVEPTETMLRAGQQAADDKTWAWRGWGVRPEGSGIDGQTFFVRDAYRAMVRAAQATPLAPSADSVPVAHNQSLVEAGAKAIYDLAPIGMDGKAVPWERLSEDKPVDWRFNADLKRQQSAAVLALCCGSAAPVPAGQGDGASAAIRDVLAERRRQVEAEGWTPEHDDAHARGEMARAACSYAYEAGRTHDQRAQFHGAAPPMWPWDISWWKPTTPRRDLVKAGALIVAEIERLDRIASPAPSNAGVA